MTGKSEGAREREAEARTHSTLRSVGLSACTRISPTVTDGIAPSTPTAAAIIIIPIIIVVVVVFYHLWGSLPNHRVLQYFGDFRYAE